MIDDFLPLKDERRIELSNGCYMDKIYHMNSKIYDEHYYNRNGEKHRDGNLPGRIDRDKNGNVSLEIYYKNDVIHRCGDKPAYILYNKGMVSYISYYKNGLQHRDNDKPAYIEYISGNIIKFEQYFHKGKLHRDGDKPANICWVDGINITLKEYYNSGDLHRDGYKPAILRYDENGKVIGESYYKNGELVDSLVKKLRNRKTILKEVKNVKL